MDDGYTPDTPRHRRATDKGSDSVRVARWLDLLAALRAGPQRRDELLARLGSTYAPGSGGQRTLARDVEHLGILGIRITVSNNRPPILTLIGPLPIFTEDELRALALVRDSFGARHPQSKPVRTLLERLTEDLEPKEQRIYQRRQALRVPLEPAIDYTPYAALIMRLEAAVSVRRRLTFAYRSLAAPEPRVHTVEPIDIEFRDRHFATVQKRCSNRKRTRRVASQLVHFLEEIATNDPTGATMRETTRRYVAILRSLTQLYQPTPQGHQRQRLLTMALLISLPYRKCVR